MMVQEANATLLRLHLHYNVEAAKISELAAAKVSPARILTLYPLDLRDWAAALDVWLADVPPAALKNIHLPVPLDLRNWAREERFHEWAIYRSSGAFDRHLHVSEQLFPYYPFSKEMFLQDLHTSLWYLGHWAGSLNECADERDVAAMTKYISRWSSHLLDPAAQGRAQLRMLAKEDAEAERRLNDE